MVRAFGPDPAHPDGVDPAVVDALLDGARRAPSAGNTQAVRFLVLDTPAAVAGYWDLTLPAERRAGFAWPGLLVAPVLVVVLVDPGAYVARYAEPDKAATGLGRDAGEWTVPYWWVDAGAAIQDLLLGLVDAGLGGCLFGLFHHEEAVLRAHGVPDGWRAAGTVALGHRPEGGSGPRGRSAGRARPPLSAVIHRGRWDQG
jgi:nitroreductase